MDFIPWDFIFFINSSKKEDIQSRATKANSICENIRHVYEDLEAHIKEHTDSKYIYWWTPKIQWSTQIIHHNFRQWNIGKAQRDY